jgi:hypothetical protein
MYDMKRLYLPKKGRSKRVSSWDKTGKNDDYITINPYETINIAEIKGPGIINHIWMTIATDEKYSFRKVLIRAYWDGEEEPSVNAPIGDFFGVGHGVASHYISLPLNMITSQGSIENKAAMNVYFEMPFKKNARFEIVNECDNEIVIYYHIDYIEKMIEDESYYFHASWRRELPTDGNVNLALLKSNHEKHKDPWWAVNQVNKNSNQDGKGNYIILDAKGEGHYVGCNLSIDNINPIPGYAWPGEGDDMFFIDGDEWPPSLHGTGTEDYFCSAWGFPSFKYYGPFHGISLAAPLKGYGNSWKDEKTVSFHDCSGKWTIYRFHILDPVIFNESLIFSLEHGHANSQSNDYASVAYWYQKEPHKSLPEILPVNKRLPLSEKESARRFFQSF